MAYGKHRVSIIAFYDTDNKILLEKRRISKLGEEWGFFGGNLKNGETITDALRREIMEELNYSLANYHYFNTYSLDVKPEGAASDVRAIEHLFVGEFPGFDKICVREALGAALFTFDQARALKLMPHHYSHIDELERYFTK
ncbi:NUDIX hydrolase [Candidatus Woesearchaeota archaeon]|nr:NUDIX hydrolase [Candidatus Woesearchaeota archaeon]